MALLKHLRVVIVCAAFMSSCAEVRDDDIASGKSKSNVAVEYPRVGVAIGSFKAAATADQQLIGAGDASNDEASRDKIFHHETALIVSPGTLTVDQLITMQNGSDLGTTMPEELDLSDVVILDGTEPLLISSDRVEDLGKTMTLGIPLPLDKAPAASLSLTAGTGKVAILYLAKQPGGNKIGLHIVGQDDLTGAIVRYKGAKFGWFRLIFLSAEVVSQEQDTQREPAAG
jgi:hypothetical protein